jgi:hypothetical protein
MRAATLGPALDLMLALPKSEPTKPAQMQTKVVLSLSRAELAEYGRWAETVWRSGADSQNGHDYALMGLGLACETGEVVDALNNCTNNGVPDKTLLKKLGDAINYCMRIANAVELQIGPGFCPAVTLDPAFPDAWAVQPQMTISTGRISEALKNLVRNEVQPHAHRVFQSKLTQALNAYLQAWLVVVASAGFTPHEVLTVNKTKVN